MAADRPADPGPFVPLTPWFPTANLHSLRVWLEVSADGALGYQPCLSRDGANPGAWDLLAPTQTAEDGPPCA